MSTKSTGILFSVTRATLSFPLQPTEVRFEVLMALKEYSCHESTTNLMKFTLWAEHCDLKLVVLHVWRYFPSWIAISLWTLANSEDRLIKVGFCRGMNNTDYVLKLIVVGNSGVGKSSFVYYFINGKGKLIFKREHQPPIYAWSRIHLEDHQNE